MRYNRGAVLPIPLSFKHRKRLASKVRHIDLLDKVMPKHRYARSNTSGQIERLADILVNAFTMSATHDASHLDESVELDKSVKEAFEEYRNQVSSVLREPEIHAAHSDCMTSGVDISCIECVKGTRCNVCNGKSENDEATLSKSQRECLQPFIGLFEKVLSEAQQVYAKHGAIDPTKQRLKVYLELQSRKSPLALPVKYYVSGKTQNHRGLSIVTLQIDIGALTKQCIASSLYTLFHEIFVHAFSQANGKNREEVEKDDLFMEGWMDCIAYKLLGSYLSRQLSSTNIAKIPAITASDCRSPCSELFFIRYSARLAFHDGEVAKARVAGREALDAFRAAVQACVRRSDNADKVEDLVLAASLQLNASNKLMEDRQVFATSCLCLAPALTKKLNDNRAKRANSPGNSGRKPFHPDTFRASGNIMRHVMNYAYGEDDFWPLYEEMIKISKIN